MLLNGLPDNLNTHLDSDPTQYAEYAGGCRDAYSECSLPLELKVGADGPPDRETQTWGPSMWAGLGAVTSLLLAFLAFAMVRFSDPDPATQSGVVTQPHTIVTSGVPARQGSTHTVTIAPTGTSQSPAPPASPREMPTATRSAVPPATMTNPLEPPPATMTNPLEPPPATMTNPLEPPTGVVTSSDE